MTSFSVAALSRKNAAFVWIVAGSLGAIFSATIAINFLFDPLMMFHAPWFGTQYSINDRHRVPGFAHSLSYDTAIIGASTAMAVSPRAVEASLGGASIMQIMNGATAAEESLAVSVTVPKKNFKRIIWLLDPIVFYFDDRRPDAPLPEHLYRGGVENALRYLLDRSTSMMSWSMLRHRLGGPQPVEFAESIDDLFRMPEPSRYSAVAVKEAFESKSALEELNRRERVMYPPFEESKVVRKFTDYITARIREHPSVQFDIVLPPSSIAFLQFTRHHFPRRFEQIMFVRKLAYDQIPTLANARLFDMQVVPEMTEDYREYSDMLHFSPSIGQGIIDAIRAGRAARRSGEPAARDYIEQRMARVPLP